MTSLTPGWASMMTATATSGVPPGGPAKAMNQAWLDGGSVPSWAVPVLPPTSKPGICARACRCRPATTPIIAVAHVGGRLRADGLGPHLGLELLDDLAALVGDSVEHVRRHDHAVVGDAGGDQRHLQRRGGDVALADRRPGERAVALVVGELGREDRRRRRRAGRRARPG